MPTRLHARIILMAAMAVFAFLSASDVGAQSPEEIRKMELAMPKKAAVSPKKAKRILVFSLTKGFKHSAVPYGEKALEIMGRTTGAFSVETTTSVAAFTPKTLKRFDAVVMNNCTGELLTDKKQQDALVDFVRNGKGLVGIHAATDCNYEWPVYGEMIGGYFDGHPWGAKDTVVVKLDEPDHPLNKGFGGKELTVTDEMYQFKAPYSRSRSRVLASLDVDKIDMTKQGIKRVDKDFAVSWIHEYGKGRVFYCSLGHNHDIFWNPVVLQHYLDGIQYAMGDLAADASPRKDLAAAMMQKAFPELLKATAQVPIEGNEKLSPVSEAIRTAGDDAGIRARYAKSIAEFLADKETTKTLAAVQFLTRMLSEIGSEEQAPVLAAMLGDPDARMADAARIALGRIEGPRAGKLLREGLANANPEIRAGIVNSIGNRADAEAVGTLAKLAASDEATSALAARALGVIGNPDAAEELLKAWEKTGQKSLAAEQALLVCAGNLAAAGETDNAVLICKKLMKESRVLASREAALTQLAVFGGAEGQKQALDALVVPEGDLQNAAAGAVLKMEGGSVAKRLVAEVPKLPAATQVRVLAILGSRGDKGAMPLLKEKAKDNKDEVRVAAIKSLGKVGDASVVPLLLSAAATTSTEERDAGRAGLALVSTGKVNEALIASLAKDAGKDRQTRKMQAEAARALLARRAIEAVPALMKAAGRKDAALQMEAWKALGAMAEPGQLDKLASLLPAIASDDARGEAEKAMTDTVKRIREAEKRTARVLDLVKKTEQAEAQGSLLRVIGYLGTDEALAKLREVRGSSQEGPVLDATVRGLVEWANSKAVPDALDIARNSKNEVHRVLAVRGLARMLGLPSDRPTSDTIALCREAMELAKSVEDKKTVIGSLAEVKLPEVLDLVVPFLDKPELAGEAAAAVLNLAPQAGPFQTEKARAALDKVAAAGDQAQRDKVSKVLADMDATSDTIVGWRLAGPYEAAGKSLEAIADEVFAPEKPAERIDWKYAAATKTEGSTRYVDLKELLGGDERAAYLRVRVNSPVEQDARLLMGSDDGLKVWWNGKQVHKAAVARALNPNEDKVEVKLSQGSNTLMVKVIQGKSNWSVAARIVSKDGKPIDGLKFDATDVLETSAFVSESSATAKVGQ